MEMFALQENIALELLRHPTKNVKSEEEILVLVKTLESLLGSNTSLSAPEIGVQSAVAIIRLPDFTLDLVNSEIISQSNPIISHGEACFSFSAKFNCLRYADVVVKNGLCESVIQLTGKAALLAQHHINHFDGTVYHDKVIRLTEVREDGSIKARGLCPCGSRRRFKECCMTLTPISTQR